jgi:hypothetical protein
MAGEWLDGTKCTEADVYRAMILGDLWFIVYFVMKVPVANHPFVVDVCKEVESGPKDYTLDVWAREHFKAVDVEEPVWTPSGWKRHGDLVTGDLVYGSSGFPTMVVGRTPVYTEADCYSVTFDDGYRVVVSGDHLWSVMQKKRSKRDTEGKRVSRTPAVLTTREMYGNYHRVDNRYAVRVSPAYSPLVPEPAPIGPYTLGAWLGDGNSSGARITCGYSDLGVIDRIREDGYQVIEGKSSNENSGIFTIGKRMELRPYLSGWGLINNKCIPEQYFHCSVEDRMNLLRGLMDTDGSINDSGTATYTGKSEKLCRGVHRLASGLGMKPRWGMHTMLVNGADYPVYRVSFQAYKSFTPFCLPRKTARCKVGEREAYRFIHSIDVVDSIPVSCIQVDAPNGEYLIGDRMVTTHNSTVLTVAETIQYCLKEKGSATAIFSHTSPVAKKFLFTIKETFQNEKILSACFPEVVWGDCEKEAPMWSVDGGLILKRDSSRPEPSISAWGLVEGMPTGMHFDRRVYDDISTEDLAESVDQMEKVKTKFDSSQNLGKEGGHHRVIGTYYHHDDPLVFIKGKQRVSGESLYTYRFKPGSDDGTAGGSPVLVSLDRWEALRQTRTFNCQQLLDPTPIGSRRLNPEHLVRVEGKDVPKGMWKCVLVDQAGDKGSQLRVDDKGDSWAVGTFGVVPHKDELGQSDVYLLDVWITPANESEAIDQIVRMYLRAGIVNLLGVEKTAQSTTHLHIAEALKARGRWVEFGDDKWSTGRLLRPAGRQKGKKIEAALGWPLNNGKLHYVDSLPTAYLDRLRQEMNFFPRWHDDGLDMWAYLYDVIGDGCVTGYGEMESEPLEYGKQSCVIN